MRVLNVWKVLYYSDKLYRFLTFIFIPWRAKMELMFGALLFHLLLYCATQTSGKSGHQQLNNCSSFQTNSNLLPLVFPKVSQSRRSQQSTVRVLYRPSSRRLCPWSVSLTAAMRLTKSCSGWGMASLSTWQKKIEWATAVCVLHPCSMKTTGPLSPVAGETMPQLRPQSPWTSDVSHFK